MRRVEPSPPSPPQQEPLAPLAESPCTGMVAEASLLLPWPRSPRPRTPTRCPPHNSKPVTRHLQQASLHSRRATLSPSPSPCQTSLCLSSTHLHRSPLAS